MDHPVVAAVREFVDAEVRPVAPALEHADAYPHALVARMRALGLFGALVPEAFGGLGLDVTTYARVIEELCRGWMSLAGVINSHTMAALIVRIAMAKVYASEIAYEVTLDSMRVHGGYGYTSEFPVERYYRDAARLASFPTTNAADRRDLARRLAARGPA